MWPDRILCRSVYVVVVWCVLMLQGPRYWIGLSICTKRKNCYSLYLTHQTWFFRKNMDAYFYSMLPIGTPLFMLPTFDTFRLLQYFQWDFLLLCVWGLWRAAGGSCILAGALSDLIDITIYMVNAKESSHVFSVNITV